MNVCPTCERHIIFDTHVCLPTFRVWCPEMMDEEQDATTVHAYDHAEAAERWMSKNDDEGYVCYRKGHMVVFVRGNNDPEPKKYRLTGEMVPEYRARAEP